MDVIVAVASSYVEAAIGVIRLSGKGVMDYVAPLFKGSDLRTKPRELVYGHIVEGERVIDEIMAVYLPSPKTYTTEDMVEIFCHGGRIALEEITSAFVRAGARPARPGEFSERAFLNGRIDLSQAEAVMDLVSSKGRKAYEVALAHLAGDTKQVISDLRYELLHLMARLTLSIDYPEEDEPEITYGEIEKTMDQTISLLERLLKNTDKGKSLLEGIKLAIIGKPNVGKSSLLNRLSGLDRAIVTDIPGTTRDTIEQAITLDGIPFVLIDTAGIRETADVIEQMGVERSIKAMEQADITVLVLSADDELDEEAIYRLQRLPEKSLVVLNKIDREPKLSVPDLHEYVPPERVIATSMTEDIGLVELEEKIVAQSFCLEGDDTLPLIGNMRQIHELSEALKSARDARAGIDREEAYDYIEVDVKNAYEHLGLLIGEEASGDILQEVFANFCVGK